MNAHARLAVGISYVVMAVLGTAFIYGFWVGQSTTVAVGRSVAYLSVLGCIHLVGYALYIRQPQPEAVDRGAERSSSGLALTFWPAVRFAIVLDGVMLLFFALLLDGGVMLVCYSIGLVGHWVGILTIAGRRRSAPTEVDIVFIRYGALLLMFLVMVLAPLVWLTFDAIDVGG